MAVQTEQMSRVVNELDSIHFSIKKASKLVKEIGRQVISSPTFVYSRYRASFLNP